MRYLQCQPLRVYQTATDLVFASLEMNDWEVQLWEMVGEPEIRG